MQLFFHLAHMREFCSKKNLTGNTIYSWNLAYSLCILLHQKIILPYHFKGVLFKRIHHSAYNRTKINKLPPKNIQIPLSPRTISTAVNLDHYGGKTLWHQNRNAHVILPQKHIWYKKEAVERWRTREVRDGLSTFRCQPQAEPEHYNWDFEKSWSKKNHSILLTTDFGITWPNSPSHPPESRLNPVLLDCSWEGWYDGVSAVEYLAVDPPPTHVLPVRPAWLSTLSVCPPQFLNFISFFMTKFTTVASPHLRRGSRARVSALFYSVQLVLL